MELGSQNHSMHGLLGPNSIIVVYMDPLGYEYPELNGILNGVTYTCICSSINLLSLPTLHSLKDQQNISM